MVGTVPEGDFFFYLDGLVGFVVVEKKKLKCENKQKTWL